MKTIMVRLGSRSYPILAGGGALKRVGRMASRHSGSRNVFICSSAPVRRIYGKAVAGSCRSAGLSPAWLMVPDGEKAKTMRVLEGLLSSLARGGAGRDSVLIALGGGTVGDLAGFAAAVFARGIAVIQVPTTLLAQVDASIGGKTGVDLPEGKNLAGAFHHPVAVLADTSVLRTLSDRQYRSGLSEAVKYGVIASPRLFAFLEKEWALILGREPRVIARVVGECARIKAAIVSRDERESGLRMSLNFGHTAGHAVESASGFRMSHGEAVSVGMVVAGRLSEKRRLCGPKVAGRIECLLKAFGLPIRIPPGLSRKRLLATMMRDKKRSGSRLRFVLTRRIGGVTLSDSITPNEIMEILANRGNTVS